ncbi:VTT domain-containing protein [bacterium]|nr:VTT domain-containing protein [bacterium]
MDLPFKEISGPAALPPERDVKHASRLRLLIVCLELFLIALLSAVWFGSAEIRASHNLWVLFFYNFPSQFLIAPVPHEPVFLYFSKYYSPALVTLFAVTGTLCTETLNYTCFKFFADLEALQKIRGNRWVRFTVNLFKKAPFAALWIAGFSPVPFYPLRFLVVLARYPVWKYLSAVAFSRTPRFYILALLGRSIHIPDMALGVFFLAITILLNIPVVMKLLKNRRDRRGPNRGKMEKAR